MDGKGKAINQLQQIDAELAALLVDLADYGIEPSALGALRSTLHEMRATIRALWQGIEHSQLSPDDQSFLRLLIGERLRLASQFNVDLGKDFAAGRIRTDQLGLSTYLRVLNQTMDELDVLLGSRQAEPAAWSQTSRNRAAPRTVLLVEDEDTLRNMIRAFLEALGWRVLEASRGVEAIQLARAHAGEIDLLLTDIEMSGMSGWQLAERVLELETRIRVLYMSGGISLSEWTDSKQKQALSHFIQKPFQLEELRALLRVILSE